MYLVIVGLIFRFVILIIILCPNIFVLELSLWAKAYKQIMMDKSNEIYFKNNPLICSKYINNYDNKDLQWIKRLQKQAFISYRQLK